MTGWEIRRLREIGLGVKVTISEVRLRTGMPLQRIIDIERQRVTPLEADVERLVEAIQAIASEKKEVAV